VDGVGGPATDLTSTGELPAPITNGPPSDTGYMVMRHGRYTRRPVPIPVLGLTVSDNVDNSEGLKGDDVDVTPVVSQQSSSALPGVRTLVPVAQADSDQRVEVLEDSLLQLRWDNEVLHKYNEDLLRHNKTLQEILQITVDKVDMHDDMIRGPNGPVRRCEDTPPQPVDVTVYRGGVTATSAGRRSDNSSATRAASHTSIESGIVDTSVSSVCASTQTMANEAKTAAVSDTVASSMPPTWNIASGRKEKALKLPEYDGVCMPFETWVQKYQNCVRHNKWTEEDKVDHLRHSLAKGAAQVLWGVKDDVASEQIIEKLSTRYGSKNQFERYRAEFKARRRKRDETLQDLASDLYRLLALGYPGISAEMADDLGRDQFLEAIKGNNSLKERVQDQKPKTMQEALDEAIRIESQSYRSKSDIACSVSEPDTEDEEDNETDNKRQKKNRNNKDKDKSHVRFASPSRGTDMDQRIKKLEEQMSRWNRGRKGKG